MTLEQDQLRKILDQMQPIIRAGEPALPTFLFDVGDGPQTMFIAAEPEQMEEAFDRARKILVFKRARSFFLSGHTAEPEGLYAAFFAPGGAAGLFRAIERAPKLRFGPDQALPQESLAPMLGLRPEKGERLDAATEAKIRSLISLHSQLEPGTPMVIQPG